MIKFIERNKEIISILSISVLVSVMSNAANASINDLKPEQAQNVTTTSQEVFLVSKEEKLQSFANKTSLTDLELKKMLSLIGFKGRDLVEAWAVAKKESGGRPLAFNGNVKTGDNSYGLFQINMLGVLGPDRRDKFELNSNAELFNPVLNAQIAYHMSNGGQDWSSWHGVTQKTISLMRNFPQ